MDSGDPNSGAERSQKHFKRAIFKQPPAWAKTGSPITIGEDAFSLSNQAYAREQQEKTRLERERAEKQKKEKEMLHKDVTNGDGPRKRRRISGHGSESGGSSDEMSRSKTPIRRHGSENHSTTPPKSVASPIPQIKDEIPRSSPFKPRREPIIIDVCSSEDEEEDTTQHSRPQPKSTLQRVPTPPLLLRPAEAASQFPPLMAVDNEEQSNSDAEFEKLARESRERRDREKARLDGAVLQAADPLLQSNSYNTTISCKTPLMAPTPLPDVKIALFVHSRIPNTNPLIVHITLTTKLKVIREAWLKRQDLPDKQKDEVYFTWRRRRLFDFTTCRSLGMSVDENGELVVAGTTSTTLENGRVEIEAVTKEIIEKDQEMTDAATKPPVPRSEAPRPPKQDEATIRIVLKARGLEDFLLKVRPTTTFEQILRVFVMKRHVDPNSSVALLFEGEKLDGKAQMHASDVADMDQIEVHIR